ncbi:MAG: PEP-CTERM sorting domain-containing protein [Candidatus Korobacteraceae bacterium]
MKKALVLCCGLVALIGIPSFAAPTVTTLYADNATAGTPYIYQIDATTGAVMNTYTNLQGINGRGVIDVGNILYYTTATSGNVYTYNIMNGNAGTAFNVAGASGLASITYDGADFWIGDYSGSNQAFLYSPTGTLLNTITLANCSGYCDGLTYFKQGGVGYLLSNRFDGGYGGPNAYDVYTTSGTFVSTLFTSTSDASTGVAWDGTSFWTSNIFDGTITQWSMTGTQLGTNTLSGWSQSPLVEGMSFNFQQTVGTPEPGTLVMFGSGVLGLAGLLRRRFNV